MAQKPWARAAPSAESETETQGDALWVGGWSIPLGPRKEPIKQIATPMSWTTTDAGRAASGGRPWIDLVDTPVWAYDTFKHLAENSELLFLTPAFPTLIVAEANVSVILQSSSRP